MFQGRLIEESKSVKKIKKRDGGRGFRLGVTIYGWILL